MDTGSFENAKQIAGTSGSAVLDGREKDIPGNQYNINKPVGEPPKDMIVLRLAMGLPVPK